MNNLMGLLGLFLFWSVVTAAVILSVWYVVYYVIKWAFTGEW